MTKRDNYIKTCREILTQLEAIDEEMQILHKKRFVLKNLFVLIQDHPEWEAELVDTKGDKIFWQTKSEFIDEANALLNSILTYYSPEKPSRSRLDIRVNPHLINTLYQSPSNISLKSTILDKENGDDINELPF